jgi:HSP20 family molecular chaperone IbpA
VADIIETEKDFQVHCELPGVLLENTNVEIVGHKLFVEACRCNPYSDFVCVTEPERQYGTMRKSLEIPCGANLDSACCTLRNGVLSIVFEKSHLLRMTSKLPIYL